MLSVITSEDIRTGIYLIREEFQPFESGSAQDIKLDEVLGQPSWAKGNVPWKVHPGRAMLPRFVVEVSSVYPSFEPRNETSWIEFRARHVAEEELLYDVFVPMPPRRKYRLSLEIRSVRRATPTIVEPERP